MCECEPIITYIIYYTLRLLIVYYTCVLLVYSYESRTLGAGDVVTSNVVLMMPLCRVCSPHLCPAPTRRNRQEKGGPSDPALVQNTRQISIVGKANCYCYTPLVCVVCDTFLRGIKKTVFYYVVCLSNRHFIYII